MQISGGQGEAQACRISLPPIPVSRQRGRFPGRDAPPRMFISDREIGDFVLAGPSLFSGCSSQILVIHIPLAATSPANKPLLAPCTFCRGSPSWCSVAVDGGVLLPVRTDRRRRMQRGAGVPEISIAYPLVDQRGGAAAAENGGAILRKHMHSYSYCHCYSEGFFKWLLPWQKFGRLEAAAELGPPYSPG